MIKTPVRDGTVLVTFELPVEVAATSVTVCGDFNEWSRSSHPLTRTDDGFQTSVELAAGQRCRFRYLLDGARWGERWGLLTTTSATDSAVRIRWSTSPTSQRRQRPTRWPPARTTLRERGGGEPPAAFDAPAAPAPAAPAPAAPAPAAPAPAAPAPAALAPAAPALAAPAPAPCACGPSACPQQQARCYGHGGGGQEAGGDRCCHGRDAEEDRGDPPGRRRGGQEASSDHEKEASHAPPGLREIFPSSRPTQKGRARRPTSPTYKWEAGASPRPPTCCGGATRTAP